MIVIYKGMYKFPVINWGSKGGRRVTMFAEPFITDSQRRIYSWTEKLFKAELQG